MQCYAPQMKTCITIITPISTQNSRKRPSVIHPGPFPVQTHDHYRNSNLAYPIRPPPRILPTHLPSRDDNTFSCLARKRHVHHLKSPKILGQTHPDSVKTRPTFLAQILAADLAEIIVLYSSVLLCGSAPSTFYNQNPALTVLSSVLV